ELERIENLLYEGQDIVPEVTFKLKPSLSSKDYRLGILQHEGRQLVGLEPAKFADYDHAEWVISVSFRKNGTVGVAEARREAATAILAYEKYLEKWQKGGKSVDFSVAVSPQTENQNDAVTKAVLPGNKSLLKEWVIHALHVRTKTEME